MKLDKIQTIEWLIIACGIALAIILLLIPSLNLLGQKEFPVIIRIDDHIGFNVSTDLLDFGTLRPGDAGKKEIHITNNFPNAAWIRIQASESIQDLVFLPENGFWLLPDESKIVPILVQVPPQDPLETRIGTIRVSFYKT